MEKNENEWNVSNLIWKKYRGNWMNSFYDNITIRLSILNSSVEYIGEFWEF